MQITSTAKEKEKRKKIYHTTKGQAKTNKSSFGIPLEIVSSCVQNIYFLITVFLLLHNGLNS